MGQTRFFIVDTAAPGGLTDPARWMREIEETTPVFRITDRGFQRGDGIFEALSVVHGNPQALDLHLARFVRSAAALRLPEIDPELWRAATRFAIEQTPSETEQYVKFMLSRGQESLAHPATFSPDVAPSAVLYIADAADYSEVRRSGVSVCLLESGRDSGAAGRAPWLLIGAKTLSYAVNVSAQLEAKARGVDDTILTTTDGYLLEGPSSSLVLLKDGVFVSTDPAAGILSGTSQQSLFAELDRIGRRTQERLIEVDELFAADGAWLVSSVRMAVAITSADGKPVNLAPQTTDLLNELLLARTS